MFDIQRAFFLGLLGLVIRTGAYTNSISSTTSYSNNTSLITPDAPTTLGAGPSVCCFAIQESFTGVWAEIYSTSIFWWIVNVTSITVRVTPYPTTTITNYETSIWTTNASFTSSRPWGLNPFSFPQNMAPGPEFASATVYNESQILIAGTTITSPQAGLIFSTAKIITAAPVTDSQGSLVCATPSIHNNFTYSVINSHAQDYWGSNPYWFGTIPTKATLESTQTITSPYISTITRTSVTTIQNAPAGEYYYDSDFKPIDTDAVKQSGVTITLATPFVYLPSKARNGNSGDGLGNVERTGDVGGTDNWGWTPQTLIDYMARQPADSSQYPGLESCLPAGPYFISPTTFSLVAPMVQFAGTDLTDSTVLTITPTPAKSAVPISQSSPASIGATLSTFAPPTIAPAVEPPSLTVAQPIETATIETPPAAPTTESTPPAISTPLPPPVESKSLAPNPLPSQEEPTPNTPLPSSLLQTENPIPITSAQGEIVSASAPPPPPTNTDSIIASQIASIIGVGPIPEATIISGMPEVIFSAPLTLPFNPSSQISGSTIIISGSTAVVMNSEITIPLSQVVGNLPGSKTLISDTLVAVFTQPTTIPLNSELGGLLGSTTVVSGTPYVVISNPTTVPVVLGHSTSGVGSGLSGNATTSQPIQASKGVRMTGANTSLMAVVLGIFACVYS